MGTRCSVRLTSVRRKTTLALWEREMSAEFSFRECGDSPAVISAAAEELFGVRDLGFVGQRWENLRDTQTERERAD